MTPVLEWFETLVPIANPSGREAELRTFIQQHLDPRIATQVDAAGNLLARVPGQPNAVPRLFAAHMDSVPPCEGITPVRDTLDGRPIVRSAGKTILGADDKAGVAVMLALAEWAASTNFANNPPLELLFTTREEVGLVGARGFDMSQLQSPWGWVLDGEGAVGDVFHAGLSQENLSFVCQGKAAHAGIEPENGVNAIAMAARLLSQLPTGRLAPDTTTNFGVVSGGEAANVVPPQVVIKGEARSHRESELQALLNAMGQAAIAVTHDFPGGQVRFEHVRRYNAFVVPPTHESVQVAVNACQALGLPSRVLPMHIGSDAHVLNERGLPTVVLGMGFYRSHSLGEHLFVDDFERVYQWVRQLLH
jgi:tripeptide aminopeptidase